MSLKWQEYTLDAKAVDDISESIKSFLESLNMERRNVLRIRLTMEELLLRLHDRSDGPQPSVSDWGSSTANRWSA